jgi:uncharacterized protein YoxC
MDWAQILVIILSIFLAIFLLRAIILTAKLIKISHQIKTVTDSAQRTADHIEKAVSGITRLTSPGLLIKELTKLFKKFKKRS